MSIVKMKRLRAVALREDRDELLEALRALGCVELRQPAGMGEGWDLVPPPNADALAKANDDLNRLLEALDELQRLSPEKRGFLTPLPQITAEALFDRENYANALDAARDINGARRDLNTLSARREKLLQQRAALAPWQELPVPLDAPGTRETVFLFAYTPLKVRRDAVRAALDGATELQDVTWCGEDKDNRYFLIICRPAVREDVQSALLDLGGGRVNLRDRTGTAAENIAALDAQLAELDRAVADAEERIAAYLPRRQAMEVAVDRARQDVTLERAKGKLLDTPSAVFLEGWVPADRAPELAALLERRGAAYELLDPAEEEYREVPIQLKSNPVTTAMNPITEMYSMPAYDGVDPNPWMAPFFIVFFGFMMNDIAYGLLMVLGTLLYLKLKRPRSGTRNMMLLFCYCGVSSILWGCVTGSLLGDFLPRLFALTGIRPPGYYEAGAFVWFWKPLFSPINDIILVMVGSLALGVIQVCTGMAISVGEKLRHGQVLDAVTQEIAWWCILLGGAGALVGSMLEGMPPALSPVSIALLILGLALLLGGNVIRARSLAGIINFGGDIYNGVSGYFSDILSYLRLMALMMAGSIIAQVFNTLGSVFGLVPFIIVAIIGNALNLVLNLLGCYVHTLRLQCLEFFGRFYKDGGKPFRPLTVDTQNVDIIP